MSSEALSYSRENLVKTSIAKCYSNKVVKEFETHISQPPVSGLIMAKDRDDNALEQDLSDDCAPVLKK